MNQNTYESMMNLIDKTNSIREAFENFKALNPSDRDYLQFAAELAASTYRRQKFIEKWFNVVTSQNINLGSILPENQWNSAILVYPLSRYTEEEVVTKIKVLIEMAEKENTEKTYKTYQLDSPKAFKYRLPEHCEDDTRNEARSRWWLLHHASQDKLPIIIRD